ncbi:hypothetical protein [Novosphingobium silvae]|jgi:hypothetical protein|uniref:hypothetical protein n=1 Tax=Novosphingobium silvae TaxID=2692619 RepID=UPI001F45E2F1|nr:hypothetical protein [Novosphingobium silvae]
MYSDALGTAAAAHHASHRELTRHESTGRGPWLRLLSQALELAGPDAEFLRHSECPWSSATFSGTRHRILVAFNGEHALSSGEAYIAALPEHEFSISRQIVADATVVEVEHAVLPAPRMTVEAELLLLDDC